jgi:curved DNA-binding protein CbpA
MKDVSAARAAAVASQLLEFYREPARVRPGYLHGEAELPEGHVVLRMALGRMPREWHRALAKVGAREVIEAARAFVRQVCLWERADHYQVLCLPPDASAGAIRESYRLLMALIHPDRQESAEPAWPTGCAQRANEAYAVLSDESARAAYDRRVHVAHVAAPFEAAPAGHSRAMPRRRRREIVRPFVAVSGVAVALFIVHSWWVGDVPQHYALLERSLPMQGSTRWVREALGDSLPRFIDAHPVLAFEPLELVTPAKAPRRLAAWVPVAEPARGEIAVANAVAAPEVARAEDRAPASSLVPVPQQPPAPKAAPLPAPPRIVVAQATSAAPAPTAAANAAPGASSPSSADIELLVARLVSYYEQGDADAMMGLFAPGEPGFWKGLRTRGAYSDFFRATKQRRLRMDQLNWRTSAQSVQARGAATLIADYADGAGRVERKLDVEIDIAMRDGRAGITRLSLFPDAR